jgi:hypothetical protein
VDKPVVGWRLAGVVIQNNHPFDILVARRADCLRADGRLVRGNT